MVFELWHLTSDYMLKFLVAWRKVKRRIWNLPYRTHNHIVHGINGDIKQQIDIGLIKFIDSCINHINYIFRVLMNCKRLCRKSVFAINCNYRSVKDDLCKRDWHYDVAQLLGKVKIKYMSVL